MTRYTDPCRPTAPLRRHVLSAACLAALLGATGAQAFDISTGNDDLSVRWDNSLRYNLGIRAQEMNKDAYADWAYDESDSKFGRGDVVANRLDLLSELDVVYQKRFGMRLSGAAWYDHAYRDTKTTPNPAYGGLSAAYANGEYTSYTKRWNRGPSGELLDAFVFGGVDLGSVPVNVKLGKHNVYWGESLFSFVHGVSYSQGPVDVRKAYTNPGVEAKELFLPLTQISGQAQLAPNFTLGAQYLFDWKPARIPDGGTYLGLADYFTAGAGTYVFNPGFAAYASTLFPVPVAPVPFAGTPVKPKKNGDWGVKASWRPDFLDGTLGFYYREYTDKLPQIVAGGFQLTGLPTDVRFSYLEGARLYGVSLSKEVLGTSVGAELTLRNNGGLLMGGATTPGTEPRGNTLHALVNVLAILPATSFWDSGSVAAEVTYSRLRKITANPGNYNGVGYGCATGDKWDGCATRDNWGFAIKFEPTWYQALNGVDLKMPVVYQAGISGNSPVLFGGYEGSGSYSLGLNADIQNTWNVGLNYNGYLVKYKNGLNPLGQPTMTVNGIGYVGDRGWVSLTVKTSF